MSEPNYRRILSILLLALLFCFSFINVMFSAPEIYAGVTELLEEEKEPEHYNEYTAGVDQLIATNLLGGHSWNEIYGTAYAMLGKNEENNFSYVRDKEGVLYYANFWNVADTPMKDLAKRVRSMQEDLVERHTRVVMLLYPSKSDPSWLSPYYGIPYQDYDAQAEEFLRYLRRYGIDYLDYREAFRNSGKTAEEMFFYSDHHWRVETGFEVTRLLVEHIRDTYGEDWDPENYYCNLDNYYTETYGKYFMGSQGRETGEVYSTPDDYTLLLPRFDVDVHWEFELPWGGTGSSKGNLRDALIRRSYTDDESMYDRDMNNAYLSGIYLSDHIENRSMVDGPKVLFLRNSYSSTPAVFLIPMVKDIRMIWNLNTPEDKAMNTIRGDHYDYVFVALTVDNLRDEELSFYKEGIPGKKTKAEENASQEAE